MNSTVKNKEKLQNTKKTKDIVKRFNYFVLSLIILLSSFSFCFADSISGYNNGLLVCEPGYANALTNSLWGNNLTQDTIIIYGMCGSTAYACVKGNRVSDSLNATYGSNSNKSLNTYDSTNDLTYTSSGYNGNTVYASGITNQSNVSNFLSNAKSVFNSFNTNIIKFPFTLQNGYLFVYDCGQSNTTYSFDLSSKSEEYSDIGSIPFPDTNQSYWFSNSLPEIDETNIPDSTATIISWQKGDKTNIFGQTQDMIATISGTSTGRYLYIYNPPVHYKWSGSSNPTASETINYPVIINGVSEDENWYIYDSVARLTDFNQGGKVSGTITGEQITGSVSSDGAISLVSSSGAIYTQNTGGSTDISGANGGSLAENINGLKETLDNFVNQFIQLLSAPISHIQQLIQSSHQFFDVFSQLFEWLPSELSSVIVSGLIIMVVIGVIKMLL